MRPAGQASSRWTTARVARWALWVLLVPAFVQLPAQIGLVSRRWDVIRQWDHPDGQVQTMFPGIDITPVQEADRRLPADARIVVISAGRDPRRSEYVAFHRAQYLLTPRQVWWIASAPRDDTWESRWSTPNALTRKSIAGFVREHGITHGLVLGGEAAFAPGVPLLESGGGKLVGFAPGSWTRPSGPPTFGPERAATPVLPRLAAALLGIFVLGAGAQLVFGRRRRRFTPLARAAEAWWLGSLLLTIVMFWLDRMGVPLERQVAVPWLLAATALAFGGARTLDWRAPPAPAGTQAQAGHVPNERFRDAHPVLVAAVVAVLAANVAFVAVLAIGQPLEAWDSWVQWGAKARAIFRSGGISASVVADPTRLNTHLHYPLFVPLREVWLFAFLGAPDDRWLGSLTLIDYLALLALAWGLMRDRGVRKACAWMTVTVVAAVFTLAACAGMVLADITLALLATAGAIHLLRWARTTARADLVLGGLAVGSLGWVKSEGIVLAAVVLVAVALLRLPATRRVTCLVTVLVSFCATTAPWQLVVRTLPGAAIDFAPLTLANLAGGVDRMFPVALFSVQVLGDRLLGWVWPVAAVVLVVRRFQRLNGDLIDGADMLLPRVALLYATVMAGSYVLSTYAPLPMHVRNSYFRLAAQVTPLLVLWLGLRTADAESR